MKALICAALEEEVCNLTALQDKDRFEILITGVGKVNATYALTKRLAIGPKPSYVLNIGSCGSTRRKIGTTVFPKNIHQFDMDCIGIGMIRMKTYKDPNSFFKTVLPFSILEKLKFGIKPCGFCYTSDTFQISNPLESNKIDCIWDMEAFALAKVSYLFRENFFALKQITDNFSGKKWDDNKKIGADSDINKFLSSY